MIECVFGDEKRKCVCVCVCVCVCGLCVRESECVRGGE